VINPCRCNATGIYCGGNEKLNLKHIFEYMNQVLPDNEKHFNKFYLNNTAITELEENTFYEITFDEIIIFNSTKLSLINTHAFTTTSLVTKTFQSRLTPLINSPPNYNIFYALTLILNIESIVIQQSNITEIPSYAFKPVIGPQNKLNLLWIDNGVVQKIGNYPFFSLNHLNELSVDANNLDFIPKDAFHFEKESNEDLVLMMVANNLNDSSFEIGSFDNLRKPTLLYLDNTLMTYLDEKIFSPFLELNHQNFIKFNYGLNCDDCRNYWLKKDYHLFGNRTNISKCTNGKSFFSNDNFVKCK
jgi:hypothetical protein